MKIERIGGWYFACRARLDDGRGFMAWCARTPELGANPLDPPDPVHFAFGETKEDALRQLKREVLQ